jgi:SAM-dependent methyltransferase
MEKMTNWHERDKVWRLMTPVLFPQSRIEKASEEVDCIISLAGIKPGSKVLDLCCGVGRHALELARRGYTVTGIDRTKSYLQKAIRQAKREQLEVEFVQDDMRRFARPKTFDIILNLYTSFGYFEDPTEDRQVIKNACRSLKKNGMLFMDMIGKEIIARIFTERDWRDSDGVLILEERKVRGNWQYTENRWIIIDGEKRSEVRFTHRPYSAVEIEAILLDCGFVCVEIFGDLEGNPYDHTAKRLVVLSRK